jgi:hypothetical protein
MPDDGECNQIEQGHDRKRREKRTRLAAACSPIEKRDDQKHQRRDAEPDDAEPLTFDAEDVAWQQLQRVKHREEVPLGSNSRRHGGKRVGLRPELPGIKRGERRQNGNDDVPGEYVTENVVRKKRHLFEPFPGLDASLDVERHAHALALHEKKMCGD